MLFLFGHMFKFGDNGVMKSKAQSADFEVLSKYQYLAISIYTALKATQTQQKSADLQGPPFPLDLEGQVLWAYIGHGTIGS
jgi:hypothetical protein